MVMIGDRYLTDVVYGNRHGMLTVRVAPLTTEGEPYGVWAARAVEEYFVGRWSGAGETGPAQALCADAQYSRFVRK
jgi:phosphatidylglycerophosphatase GEP4